MATSSGSLWEALNGLLVPLSDLWHVSRGVSMQERVEASRSHAAWAPRLVDALRNALKRWQVEGLDATREEDRMERCWGNVSYGR